VNAIVFGGSGFLGSYVADELIEAGHQVTVFDKNESRYLQAGQTMVVGDILNPESVRSAIQGHDVVYNFAGLADLNASIDDPVRTLNLNVFGNLNLLQAAKEANVKRFVYASTVYVFSSKGSYYGISKRTSEQVIEEFCPHNDIDFTIVRYGSVYGKRADRQNRIYRILRQALESKKIVFEGNGEEEREYIHVQDAAKLSVEILGDEFKNQRIILTGVERFKYSQLLELVKEMLEGKVEIEYLNEDYQGHYTLTPYSYKPKTGRKVICNPYIDFGQGLLDTLSEIHEDIGRDAHQ